MARPTETEKLLEALLKETKKNNRQTESLEELAQESAMTDGRRPVKSIKPNLFVTGKRASQSDYIAARGAEATEKYTKAYLKEVGGNSKKEKKKASSEKKEKADAIKREDKNLEKQLDISNKMLDVLEIGVKSEDKAKLDEVRRHKSGLALSKKIEEQRIKDAKSEQKRNQGMFANILDYTRKQTIERMEEYRDSVEDTLKLGSKERRQFAKQEREEAKDNLERVRDMIINNQQDQMSYHDKQLAKVIEENNMSIEIDGLTKGVKGISVDIVKSADSRSRVEMDLQREFFDRTGKSVEEFRDEQRKEKAKSGRDTFAYRQWIRQNEDSVKASQNYSIQLAEQSMEINAVTAKKIYKQNARSQDVFKHIKEVSEYAVDNIRGLKEESAKANAEAKESFKNLEKVVKKSGDKTSDAVDKLAEQEKKSAEKALETAEEAKEDQKAEYRDNFLKRAKEMGLRAAMAQSLADLVKNSKEQLNTTKDNLLKKVGLGKDKEEGSGGGFLSSMLGLGALKVILPKILKMGFISKILGKMGGFGKMITGFGESMGKMSFGRMALGAMVGDGVAESLMGAQMLGGDSGPKATTKNASPKKAGIFSRVGSSLKSGGSKLLGMIPGAGLVKEGASKLGGKAMAKGAGKSILKKIPGVSILAGLGFGAQRAMSGDFLGAGGELLSGLLGTIPGLGTAASLAIDAGLMARDASKAGEQKTKGAKGAKSPKGVKAKGKAGALMNLLKFAIPGVALAGLGSSLFGGDEPKEKERDETDKKIDKLSDDFTRNYQAQFGTQNQVPMNSLSNANTKVMPVIGALEKTITDNTLSREKSQLKIIELLEEQNRFMREENLSELTEGNIQRGKTQTAKGKFAQKEKSKSLWDKMKEFGSNTMKKAQAFFGGKEMARPQGGAQSAGGGSAGGGGGGSYGGKGLSQTGQSKEAIDFFVSKGWSKEQAIGLVANLMVESNLKTSALGDSGAAYGIAQWHPDRQAEFAKVFGKDIRSSTFNEQLEFVHHELTKGNERRAGGKIKQTTSATDAAAVVDQFYERSSGEHRGKRIKTAENLMGNYSPSSGAVASSGTAIATTDVPTSSGAVMASAGITSSSPGMVDGTISAVGTGTSSTPSSSVGRMVSNSPVTSTTNQTKRAIGGAVTNQPKINSLPFNGLLSQISGGQGKLNSSLMNSQKMIGQGMSSISAMSQQREGVFTPPYVSSISDPAMDILKGRSLFDS